MTIITNREHEVLKLIANGYSNEEILNTLVIAQATLKAHLHNLYKKLQVKRTSDNGSMRVRLALMYWQNKFSVKKKLHNQIT